MIHKAADRQRILMRLKRAAGQLRAVEQMIDAGSDCEAVVQQMSACRRAMDKAFIEVLACAMVPEPTAEPDAVAEARLAEVADLLRRYG